jgi:hypothetical protein
MRGVGIHTKLGVLLVRRNAMDLAPMQAETTALLELGVAAVDLTGIGVKLRVSVPMLGKVLFLGKPAVA